MLAECSNHYGVINIFKNYYYYYFTFSKSGEMNVFKRTAKFFWFNRDKCVFPLTFNQASIKISLDRIKLMLRLHNNNNNMTINNIAKSGTLKFVLVSTPIFFQCVT